MLTKKVTDDENFMQLSSSAQALYLHLNMAADDDGFCNQISVSMFKAHASVQDLQALLEKRYLLQFENGVLVIKHWRMANALRKDRYTPTAFREELARLKIKENGSYTFGDGLPDGYQMVAEWLPDGCHSIDKDRLDKISIDEDSVEEPEPPRPSKSDIDRVVEAWNSLGLSKVTKIPAGSDRYNLLNKRLKDFGVDAVLQAIENIRQSSFLNGNNSKGWFISFDWFVKPNNFPKVLDGNYADSKPQQQPVANNKKYSTGETYKPPVPTAGTQEDLMKRLQGLVDQI